MKTLTTMHVEGMFCPKCVKKLRDTASGVKGIAALEVEADLKTVNIEYDSDLLDLTALKQMIETVPDKDFKVLQNN